MVVITNEDCKRCVTIILGRNSVGGRKLIWKEKGDTQKLFLLNVPELNDQNSAFYCFWSSNWWSIGPSGMLAAVYFFLKIFFWCGPFFKVFIITLLFLFYVLAFGREVFGILTPQPGLKPTAPVLRRQSVTTEQKPLALFFP